MMIFFRCAIVALMLTPAAGAAQNYWAGVGASLEHDYARALREWRPLAVKGDAKAQYSLGELYRQGRGVRQDHAEAAQWYRMSADQGHERAQFLLGQMYFQGQGVPQDHAEAARWYRMVAKKGDVGMQFNLGLIYRRDGSIQDYVAAHTWFNIAAANGHRNAAANRESVSRLMTADEISEAQRRARACMDSGYEDCD